MALVSRTPTREFDQTTRIPRKFILMSVPVTLLFVPNVYIGGWKVLREARDHRLLHPSVGLRQWVACVKGRKKHVPSFIVVDMLASPDGFHRYVV